MAATRADIADTTSAIQERLQPEKLVTAAKNTLMKQVSPRDQEETLFVKVGEAAGAVLGKVVENTAKRQLKKSPRARKVIAKAQSVLGSAKPARKRRGAAKKKSSATRRTAASKRATARKSGGSAKRASARVAKRSSATRKSASRKSKTARRR